MFKSVQRTLAVAGLTAIAACSSGGTTPKTLPVPIIGPSAGITQQNFAGIGDSLTFGEQAGGDLGAPATSPISALPGNAVPPTQTNGFWALMYAQMNGIALDPAHYNLDTALGGNTSPLPLIAAPGLGSQLVVSAVKPPFSATHSPCDQINQAAYSPSAWTTTRVNPIAPIANLGIPGLTMHEAAAMTGPLTGPPNATTCSYTAIPGDITSGAAQQLVEVASELFYPVLGQFENKLGTGKVTPLSAAVALQPKLTTVWLGANDLLDYIGSHGLSPVTDTPQQLAADLTNIVTTLEKSGSKVVIGNLPDILGNPASGERPVPAFFPQTNISADMQALGVPASAAAQLAAYVSATYTKGNGGFLTATGLFSLVGQVQANPTALPNLDPNGPGSGDGTLYLDQMFAAQAIALNAGYNQAIDSVAAGTGAALADVQTGFQQLAANGITIGPMTLTLQYGGGILSFDGLHPSNVGYALVANIFIGAADSKFGMTIPPIDGGTPGATFGAIAQTDPYNPYVIKSMNPAWPFPLP